MKNNLAIGAHFDDSELGTDDAMAKRMGNGALAYKMILVYNVINFDCNNAHIRKNQSLMLMQA